MVDDGQKRGPWSRQDKEFIRDSAGKISPQEIAETLGRNVKAIEKYMREEGFMKYYVTKKIEDNKSFANLSRTPYWNNLVKQFTAEELETFQYHWQNITKQFNDDIFHTEELQIVDVIKFEILMNRILDKESKINQEIEEMSSMLEKERLKKQKDIELIKFYSVQVESLYRAVQDIQKEYSKLHDSKTKILSALKATREQRIKQIESSKENYVDWVKQLIKDPERRKKFGIYMEKNRVAAEVEYQRLSELHTYSDGMVDQPILNGDNVV